MIVPTPRAVWAMAGGVPVALAAGLLDDRLWVAGPAWIAAMLLLLAADAATCRRARAFRMEATVPDTMEVGRDATMLFRFAGNPPPLLELAPDAEPRLELTPTTRHGPGNQTFAFSVRPLRRGTADVTRLHLRWRGALGLVRAIRAVPVERPVAVVPQIGRVREEAMRLLARERRLGSAMARPSGEGAAFRALREFRGGDDRRQIDWRHSARHATLLVREHDTERDGTVFVALDTGRLMSAPLAHGLSRLDHALNAALMLSYACLRAGDRVGVVAFDARPVLQSGLVTGLPAFAPLQRLLAGLDYSNQETNFALGLSSLVGGMQAGRGGGGLAVVFTDFADPTGAELMVETVGRLLERHRVLFVAFRDDGLEALAAAPPDTADAVAQAVVAATLLRERDAVLARLRRLGVGVVETPAAATGPALIARYLSLRRQAS